MEINDFATLVFRKKKLILYFIIVFFTISAVLTVIQPFNYQAKMRLMVVQSFERQIDPYSIAKSNQYISFLLANVISSSLFYDDIINSDFNIVKDYFYSIRKSEIERWNEVVRIGAVDDTGIIAIEVLHTDKYQAEEIARAITDTIRDKYRDYYKVPLIIEVKVLDKIQVSNYPVKPNVVMNLSLGMMFGIISGMCYIYMFAEKFKKIPKKLMSSASINPKKLESLSREDVNNGEKVIEVEKTVTNFNKQKNNYSKEEYSKIVKKGDIKNLFG